MIFNMCMCCVLSCFSHVCLFVTPWTVAHQTPLSMGFSWQEYWCGLPFPSPGDLPSPGTAAHQPPLSITNSWSLLKLISIESVMPSSIFCHPRLLPPSIFPNIRVFSNESALCIRWPKYWSFSFNIIPSNEQSELIAFRVDWLDLLAVQGTLKSLL